MEGGGLNIVGTTGIAFKIKEGIVVGVDSLAGAPGLLDPYSLTYMKIYNISLSITCAMAGCLKDGEDVLDAARSEWRHSVSVTNRTRTVEQVADFVYKEIKNREVSFLIAGYTDQIAHLWETRQSGNKHKDIAVIGRREDEVLQFLKDNGYHYDMGRDAAADLVRRAICKKGLTDPLTGGDSIKVLLIKVDGVEFLSIDAFDELMERYHLDEDQMEE